MNGEHFAKLTATQPLWRFLALCRRGRMAGVCAAIVLLSLVAALVDRSMTREAWTIPVIVLASSVIAIEMAKRFARRIGLVLEGLEDAFVDTTATEVALCEFVSRRSMDVYWVSAIGVISSVLLYSSMPKSGGTLSSGCYVTLSVVGGIVFGFALVKYIWDYRLIWFVSTQPVDIWKVHRLKELAAYNYSLTLVALLPCLISLYFWAARRTQELLAFAAVQGVLAMCVFMRTEFRIVRMAKASDQEVLNRISKIQSCLWSKLQETDDVVDVSNLAHLETVRRSLSSGNAFGVISWGDFVAKIAVPFVAGAIGVIYQLFTAH